MPMRFARLGGVTVAACICGTVLAGGGEKTTPDGKEAKNWHTVRADDRISVSVERALYERPGEDSWLIQVRVTNRTNQRIGLALDYDHGIYPNQWGFHNAERRGIIDEERIIPGARTDEKRTELLKTFTGGGLTIIPPNQSVTFFRRFRGVAGTSGRREVERQSKQGSFLIVSIDGQLFYTDGQSLFDVHCRWNGEFGPTNSDVVLKLPIEWKQVPKMAAVVEGRVRP